MAKGGQTIRLVGERARQLAIWLITKAPEGAVMNLRLSVRTNDQNAKMWAMLSDIARAKPDGRHMPSEDWKCVFMRALKIEIRFLQDLEGEFFPVGYASSDMTVGQMSAMIEYLYWYGAQHNIQWSEPPPKGYDDGRQ